MHNVHTQVCDQKYPGSEHGTALDHQVDRCACPRTHAFGTFDYVSYLPSLFLALLPSLSLIVLSITQVYLSERVCVNFSSTVSFTSSYSGYGYPS